MSIQPGRYYIRVKGEESQYLAIGPVPLVYPPIDVPVRLLSNIRKDGWTLEATDDDLVIVTETTGIGPYKWIKNDDDQLFVSATNHNPGKFEFKSAGDNTYTIKASDGDLLLTKNDSTDADAPQLVFKPAEESDAQLFVAEPYDADDLKGSK